MEVLERPALAVPSAISATGYTLVHDGVKKGITTPEGLAEVFCGRMADLADGFIARQFGLTSKPGALADAAFDKKATLEILEAVSGEGLIPSIIENAVRTQNLTNAALTLAAKARQPKRELLPSPAGKKSMFFQGLTMGSYALSETIREGHPGYAKTLRYAGHLMGAAGLFYYGTKATVGYAERI